MSNWALTTRLRVPTITGAVSATLPIGFAATTATLSGGTSSGTTNSPMTVTVTLNGAVPSGGYTATLGRSGVAGSLAASSLVFTFGGPNTLSTTNTNTADGASSVTLTGPGLTPNGTPQSYTSSAASAAPTGNITQYLTSDGGTASNSGNFSGPTRDFWHKRMGHAWKRLPTSGPLFGLGNWLDAALVEDGPTPYASTAAATTVGQVLSANVTALVQRWDISGANRGFYLMSRGTLYPLFCYGRGNATASNRPKLVVVTSVATYEREAAANACWFDSSFTGSGSKNQWSVSQDTNPAVLRFDLTGIRGVISSATLSFVVSAFDTGHTGQIVDVFELDPPTLLDVAPINSTNVGVRNTLSSFSAWKTSGHASLVAADDFEAGGPFNSGFTPAATLATDSATGTVYAVGEITAGSFLSVNTRLDVSQGTGVQGVPNVVYDELFGQYHLYLENDFGTTADTAIKIPAMGVQFGYWQPAGYWQQTTGNGGSPGTGLKVDRGGGQNFEYQGHSIRFLTGVNPTALDDDPYTGWFGIGIYDYNLDQIGPFPAGAAFPNVVIRKEQTYCFDIRVKQNTMSGAQDGLGNYATANADGIYQVWINGHLSYSRTNYRWRRHAEMGVQGVWLDVYHGGTIAAPTTMHYRLDRVSVGTSYIGPALRETWPAWRRAMAANTWATVPSTNTMADISPQLGATNITPVGADYVARGMVAGFFSWTGGVWDDVQRVWHAPTGGGHTDYGGNEPYKIGFGVDAPIFSMTRAPTGAIGNAGVTRDGLEGTGVYFDGRLRAVHTYNNQTFIPGLGPVLSRMTGPFYTASGLTSRMKAYWLDSAGETHLISDYSAITGQGSGSTHDGASAYDSRRNCLWTVGHNSSRLVQIDLGTGIPTARGSSNFGYFNSGGTMLLWQGATAAEDVLLFLSTGGGLLIMRIGAGIYTTTAPTVSGSFSGGLLWPNFSGAGAKIAPELGAVVIWQNSTSRAEISTLTPSNPADLTQPWTRGVRAPSAANLLTPPVADSNGVFGRFGYSSSLRGCYLIPDTSSQPLFFATE